MRKTMFRWLITLAVLLPCMMLTVFATERTVVDSGYCGGERDGTNLTWTLYDDGELIISGTGAMEDYDNHVYTPWYNVQGRITTVTIEDGVTAVGCFAFSHINNLTSVTIPKSVTSIRAQAFESSGLTKVTIPNGVTSIGDGAFWYCRNLTSIILPDTVTRIGESAFSFCSSLESITIPAGVTYIARWMLDNCSSLKNVTLPDGITSIGYSAFYNCRSLTTITLPSSVTNIDDGAFSYCVSLKNIIMSKSVTYIGTRAFEQCDLTSIILPDTVIRIGESAFSYCSELNRVEFLGDAPAVGNDVFRGCYNLTTYYHEDTAGWTDSEYYDVEAETWCGRPLVMIAAPRYSVTSGETVNGTVRVDKTEAKIGEQVTITATPAQGYRVKEFMVDGVAIQGNTFTATGEHVVTAVFEEKPIIGYFSLEVVNTIIVNGEEVDICRWVWTPFAG